MLGTLPQVEAGTLKVLAGGDAEAVARITPLLEVWGDVLNPGAARQAAALKLAVNGLLAAGTAALAECLALVFAHGADREATLDLFDGLAVLSPAVRGLLGLVRQERFDPLFPVRLVEKDLGYAVGALEGAAQSATTLRGAQALFTRAMAAGFGDENLHAVVKATSR